MMKDKSSRQVAQDEVVDSMEREEYDDVYFGAASPWEDEFSEYYDEEDEEGVSAADRSTVPPLGC